MTTAAAAAARRPLWWERSIGVRIIVLFLGMLLAVQLASFGALRASLVEHAHRVLPNKLREGERLLQSLLERRADVLVDGARLLAADYAFREAVSSNDAETIASALANHGARIGATEVALLGNDFRLRSSTAGRAAHRDGLAAVAGQLAAQAAASGQPSTIALIAGEPHQAVLVPVKAPVVVGWVLMAFPIDGKLGDDLKSLSGLGLTLVVRGAANERWRVAQSSVDPERTASLARARWDAAEIDAPMAQVAAAGEELGVRAAPLGPRAIEAGDRLGLRSSRAAAPPALLALLSLSVDDAVRLPGEVQLVLIAINAIAIAVFAVFSVFTARRVTTPLHGLAAAAERLGAGDFATPMPSEGLSRGDEVGELAQSFERMRVRLAENQAQILRLAYRDGLTGLPNRARFREAVHDAVRGAAPGTSVAVVMLDLDRFKHVNDVLGYRIGDLLLVQVGERLGSHVVRDGDVVARLGGDEFGVLLRVADATRARAVAERIERAFDKPLSLEGHQVDMGLGLGIACWPAHADDADGLLNRAEVALHAAKLRSAGPLCWDATIDVASARTLTLMTELRQAVELGELRLFLQPKLSLDDGRVVGAEALVRWQHGERGMVPPAQFIPFAEQTGFIRVLTMWVFEEAARHRRRLDALGIAATLSVNLSTRDLLDAELPQKFAALLARHRVEAAGFCLEITESAIMDEPQRSLATLDRLSAMGFRLSIDDFGTGYSSLAYLKRLPVDELKIDQSFVRGMQADKDDATIVRSTIDLAHNLGIAVVAEGVETAEVWTMLRDLGCDHAQGYYMGRPMPFDDFVAHLGERAAARADAPPVRRGSAVLH